MGKLVEVITCEECEYWKREEDNYMGRRTIGRCESKLMQSCVDTLGMPTLITNESHYCGYAERRTDGQSN